MKPTHHKLSGSCLCQKIQYTILNPQEVILCHCRDCLKYHGHLGAYTRVPVQNFSLTGEENLSWFAPPGKSKRGFCKFCGSHLFWKICENEISITAGTLHPPTHLTTTKNIYTEEAGDYYPVEDLKNYHRASTHPPISYAETRALGKHLLFELRGIQAVKNIIVEETLLEIAKAVQGKILHQYFHSFIPKGITGFVLLSESHISIHTWPENEFATLEVFMCRDYDEALITQIINRSFKPQQITQHRKLTGKNTR